METNIDKVWIENDHISVETPTEEIKSHPLKWFPRLANAPKTLLEKFTLSPFRIHWEALDEDLSFKEFFNYSNELPILEKK